MRNFENISGAWMKKKLPIQFENFRSPPPHKKLCSGFVTDLNWLKEIEKKY